MERIYLESEHASRLQTYLLMTTKFREEEVATWTKIADERNEDGTIKYPNAKDNADFWKETITAMSAVVEALNHSETVKQTMAPRCSTGTEILKFLSSHDTVL